MYIWPNQKDNPPLTLEQMEDIVNNGQKHDVDTIVWAVEKDMSFSIACVLDCKDENLYAIYGLGPCLFKGEDYGETWIAYAKNPFEDGKRPPAPAYTNYVDFYDSRESGNPIIGQHVVAHFLSDEQSGYHSGRFKWDKKAQKIYFCPDTLPLGLLKDGFVWAPID